MKNSFKAIFESPVGKVGRTSSKDAENFVTDDLRSEFKKIVKKIGGKAVALQLLKTMNAKTLIDEAELDEAELDEAYSASAEEAYELAAANIAKSLKVLNAKIAKHKKSFEKSDKKDWGYAGDLITISDGLEDLILS